jgi:hypothetical protein
VTNGQSNPKRLPLPDLADIIFLLLLQLTLYLKPDFVFSDGSTGWHLVSGNFMLEQHAIPHTDLFSYTFPGKPWVAYEWLSDLVMAALVKLGGLNLLATVVSCAISLLFILLYLRCRKYGCHFLFAVVLCVLGAIVSSIHWLARPHIFVFFGVYIFATALEDFWQGTPSSGTSATLSEVQAVPSQGIKSKPAVKLLATLGLTMLVWVNVHPGFLIGFAMLGIYLFCAIFQTIVSGGESKTRALNRTKILTLAFIVAGATTLCNPYFLNLYTYIHDYLSTSAVLAATDEFTSPIFHGDLQPTCLEILYAIFIIGLAVTKRPLSFPYLLLSIAFCHLSLSAKRNMPLLVIVLLPAIGQLFSRTIFDPAQSTLSEPLKTANLEFSNLIKTFLTKMRTLNVEFTENERLCSMHILPWAAFAILCVASIGGGNLLGFEVLNTTFDHEHKPTTTLTAIKELKLDPKHGFNFDNWGGYIRYEMNIPVFIDDRADFYGEKFYTEYAQIVQIQPGWADALKKHEVNWILFPTNSPLVGALKESPDWKLAAQDKPSSLFVRK